MSRNASRGDGRSLLDHGYISIGLDDNWQACGTGINGSFHDAQGHPLINTASFPDMKSMVAHGHSKGVKMGWYLNNCICTERDHLEPDWSPQMHGDVNALLAADWDGVKLDSCGPSHNLAEWYDLLNATGKAIEIENCHNNVTFPYVDDTGELQCPHHFFRVSHDINPSWQSVTGNLQCSIKFNQLQNPVTRPGCWAYPDMLEVGNGMATSPMDRSHFGAWVITSAPLVLGLDLANDNLVSPVWDVITNDDAINISQTYFLHPGFLVADEPPSSIDADVRVEGPKSKPTTASAPGHVWAIPPNATDPSQLGWAYDSSTKALSSTMSGSASACLSNAQRGFEFDTCNTSDPDQQFVFESNGNLHTTGHTDSCVASKGGTGPDVVSYACNTGSNEEWTFFDSNNSVCSAQHGHFPVRCLARRPGEPKPVPSPGAASWQVYAKPQPNNSMAVLLFNMAANSQLVAVDLSLLGFEGTSVHVRALLWPLLCVQTSIYINLTVCSFDCMLRLLILFRFGTSGPKPQRLIRLQLCLVHWLRTTQLYCC